MLATGSSSPVHHLGEYLAHGHAYALVFAALAVAAVASRTVRRLGGSGRQRDPQRAFSAVQRQAIFARAGYRCEHQSLFGRCTAAPTHADHIHPWSKGGATTLANGAATCARHNLRKGAKVPSGWSIRRLESRRRRYFPPGAPVEVSWRIGERP